MALRKIGDRDLVVDALLRLIVVREGGTQRELSEARAVAVKALLEAGVAVELPRY